MVRSSVIRCCVTQLKTVHQLKNVTASKGIKFDGIIQLNQAKIRKGGVRETNLNNGKKFNVTSLSLLSVPIFSFYLGCWQVKRMKWKKELIESLNAQGKDGNLRDEHFTYALTWFSLSAITLFMWITRFLK